MELLKLTDVHIYEKLLSEASVKKYRSVAKTFVADTGIQNINDIQHSDIFSWRDAIINRSSVGNWNNYHRHMRAIFQTAVCLNYVNDNLFKQIKAITHYPDKENTLTDEQIESLFKICDDQISYGWFWKSVIQMLLYTGIRRKQLVGLTWGDVDFENKTLKMQASSSKTKRAYTIPINQQLINSILFFKHKTKYLPKNPQSQIFNVTLINPRYKGDKLKGDHVAQFFTKASKTLNFKVSAHRFRHTFATKLANNSLINIKTVQNLLGHSSVHTTLGYVHPNINNMRDAVDLL